MQRSLISCFLLSLSGWACTNPTPLDLAERSPDGPGALAGSAGQSPASGAGGSSGQGGGYAASGGVPAAGQSGSAGSGGQGASGSAGVGGSAGSAGSSAGSGGSEQAGQGGASSGAAGASGGSSAGGAGQGGQGGQSSGGQGGEAGQGGVDAGGAGQGGSQGGSSGENSGGMAGDSQAGSSGNGGVGGPGGAGAGGSIDCPVDTCDGLCTELLTDVANCGQCGNVCGAINGQATCVDGQCALQCQAGFEDCDGLVANGCEAQLALDPKNCGACGLDCLGGKCESNSCLPFTLTKDIVASKIILHSGFLYAGTDSAPDYSGGYVARASTQDGSVEILDAQPGHTGWIDVNDDGVFWTAKGMLYTTKHDGSEIKIILSSANAVAGISVFGNKLAWATKNGASSANMDGSDVYYYSTEGFVGAIDSQVLIDENYVYWFMSGGWLMWGHINAKAEFWLPSISSMILDGPKKEDFFFVKDELGSVRKIRKY